MTGSEQVRRWTLVVRREDEGLEHGWSGGPGVDPAHVPPLLELVPVVSLSDLQREIAAVRGLHGMDPAAMSVLGELVERLGIDVERKD